MRTHKPTCICGAPCTALVIALAGLLLALNGAQAASKNDVLSNDMRTPMSVAAAPKHQEPKALHTKKYVDIDKALALEEAGCYQRFAVNRCLSDARSRARNERFALDAVERAQKTATRLRASELQRAERAQRSLEPGAASASASASASTSTSTSAKSANVAEPRARPASNATKSAPSRDVQSIRQQRAMAQSQRDARALAAQHRLAQKRAEAERHQTSMAQRREEREARGIAAPAPLPASAETASQ